MNQVNLLSTQFYWRFCSCIMFAKEEMLHEIYQVIIVKALMELVATISSVKDEPLIVICSLCRVELVVQFPARGSTQVLLCPFPGVLWL